MASSSWNGDMWKKIEDALVDVGIKLLKLSGSGSNDEILALLLKAESLLFRVYPQPPESTKTALIPAKQALITDKLMRNADLDIQIAVASCLNELTRITVPDAPYDDEKMKEIFQLYLMVLRQLSNKSETDNYRRAWRILGTLSTFKACVILLDVDDSDQMVVDMFNLFYDIIRSNKSPDVVDHIEMIMTTVLEEIEEISIDLLKPLVESVRLDNKSISPISWTLGKTVIEKGASNIQLALREAVEALNIKVDDYAEIVASLCKDTSSNRQTMVADVAATVECVTDCLSGDVPSSEQIVQLKGVDVGNSGVEADYGAEVILGMDDGVEGQDKSLHVAHSDANMYCAEIGQSESDTGAVRRSRRLWKPNTKRVDEGYHLAWIGPYSLAPYDANNEEKGSDSAPDHKKANSQKGCDSVNGGGHVRRAESQMKEVMESSISAIAKYQRNVKKTGSKLPNKSGRERGNAGLCTSRVQKAEGIPTDTDSEEKDGLLLQDVSQKKEIVGKISSEELKSRDVMNKIVESDVSSPGETKNPWNVKKRGADSPNTTRKRWVTAQSTTVSIEKSDGDEKGKGIQSDTHIDGNEELLLLEISRRKETGCKIDSEKHELEDTKKKSVERPATSPIEVCSHRNLKKRGPNAPKLTSKKKVTAESSTVIAEKGKGIPADTDLEEKHGSLRQLLSGKKYLGDLILHKHESKDVANMVVESPTAKPARTKGLRTVRKRGPIAPKKTDARGFLAGSCTLSVGEGEQIPSDTDSEKTNELLGEELSARKRIGVKIISKKHESSNVAIKMEETPMAEATEAKSDLAGSSTVRVEKGEGIPSDTDTNETDEIVSQTHKSRYVEEMKLGSSISNLVRPKYSSNAKDRGSGAPTSTVENLAVLGPSTVNVGKRDRMPGDAYSEKKGKLILQKSFGRKRKGNGNTSQKHEPKDVAEKTVVSSEANPIEAECPRNSQEPEKNESSLDYGEELVNTRIKVWWPMDKTFYTGTVAFYDSQTKKHMIKYDDDEEEILNLKNERWEPFTFGRQQAHPFQKQEANLRIPDEKPVNSQKRTPKRKGGSSKKQPAASSSKRSKTISCRLVKSRDFAPKDDDTDDNEMREAYFLNENAGGSHAGKAS